MFNNVKKIFKETFEFLVFILPIMVIAFGMVFAIVYPLNKYTCNYKGELYGVEVKYNLAGCFVETNGSYVPMNIYEESTMKATNVRLIDGE